MILPRLLRLIGRRDYNNCWFFIHLNSFWGWCTHTGANLNITWIFTVDSWLKTCWNDTWETQKGSSCCDAHILHIDGGLNIGRACQSIPTMNEGMQRASKIQSQKSHFLLLPWFHEVKQPISAHLSHTADTQIPAETNTGHGGHWLKQRGTQSDFLWSGCFYHLIITLVFIRRLLYALYRLCLSIAFESLVIFILFYILSLPSELGL